MSEGEVKEVVKPAAPVYQTIADLGGGIIVAKVNVNALREQDMNARVMSKAMMEQLAKNIKKRGYLESLPYCALTDRGIEIVSGHHRVRASRMAEIQEIYILLDTNNLRRDEIIARQLAHNSIQGVDDKEMLRKLYEAIEDVDVRLEAFINEADLKMDGVESVPVLDIIPEVEVKTVSLFFLPSQYDKFDKIVDKLNGKEDAVYAIPDELFARFKDTITKLQKTDNIKAIGMAVARMCDITEEWLKENGPEEEEGESEAESAGGEGESQAPPAEAENGQ